MELKLLHSESALGSEVAVHMPRSYSSSALSFRDMVSVRFSPKQFCSCRGSSVRASYSRTSNNTHLSNGAVGSVSKSNFLTDSYSYHINGTNGMSSNIYLAEASGVLDAFDDEYGGVIVNAENLPTKANAFASILRSSLTHWRMERTRYHGESTFNRYLKGRSLYPESRLILSYINLLPGKKGIWLKLPTELVDLVPVAVKEGFQYHHAEKGYVMLTYWIPEEPSLLPANASHQVGVGGFVMNDKNEVLVVQEKYCSPTFAGLWKLPTGFILESEEIYEGAVREVKEETGIDTQFVEVIAFRHAHNVAFEKSDLFFICMLRPVSTQIMVDDHEVQAAKWMPLMEFVEQPLIQGDRMFKKIMDICIARLGRRYCGLHPHQVISKFDGKESTLYYNVVDSRDSNCKNIDEQL